MKAEGGDEPEGNDLVEAVNAKVKILPIIVKGLYDIKPKTRWTINTAVEAKMIIDNPIDTINQSVDSLINKVNDYKIYINKPCNHLIVASYLTIKTFFFSSQLLLQ